MAEIPEWDNFVPVPYRKPDIDNDQTGAPPAGNKKSRKNRGQNVGAIKAPVPASTESTANPFAEILSEAKTSGELDGLTEDERQQYEAMLKMEEEENKATTSKSKKEKWTPLFTAHGNDLQIKLSGRYPCQCMCTKHDLIHNCINCGRIVCEQEGSGPCFTCGKLVCTPAEMAVLHNGGLEAEKLRRRIFGDEKLTLDFGAMLKLNSDGGDEHLAKAEAHRNTLLNYDKTAAQRTKIIDDQADYFSENVFQSPEQRKAIRLKEEELRKKRFESKKDRNRKFDLDFAGREFRQQGDTDTIDEMYAEPEVAEKAAGLDNARVLEKLESQHDTSRETLDTWSLESELAKVPAAPPSLLKARNLPHRLRVQDHELQEMVDEGMALSIMQPWASLVVMGLKPHEGRNWYSAHRGKLWIVSGSTLPPPKEIIQEENAVKALTGNDLIVFPVQYQTGFLLGCVDLIDCISQEEYQKRYPGALLKYPYIFILENPKELERTFPVESKSKIFKLDHRLHEVAKLQGWKKPDVVWLPESTYGYRFREDEENQSLSTTRFR